MKEDTLLGQSRVDCLENNQDAPERYYYLDWLRVSALICIFLFHALHIFAPLDWHINNEQRSQIALLFMMFINGWSMPLFFVLAGAGAWFALEHRTPTQFCWSRLKRLVVPYVFGVIVIILPQKYFEALHKDTFQGGFLEYIPHYFQSIEFYPHVGQLGNIGYHLWFIAFLFIYSVVTLPLMLCYKTYRNKQSNPDNKQRSLYSLFAFTVPLMIVQVALGVRHAGHLGWANFFYWMLFYLYGFVLVSQGTVLEAIQKSRKHWLITGSICFAAMVICLVSGSAVKWMFEPQYTLPNILFLLLICINAWAWVLTFIGIAKKYMSFNHRFLKYANTAVLPFYILHQTVIVLVGYYVVQMNASMPLKYILIAIISFITILTIYESTIKRFSPIRSLFGMK